MNKMKTLEICSNCPSLFIRKNAFLSFLCVLKRNLQFIFMKGCFQFHKYAVRVLQ